jgi:hypothetical protein
MLKLAPDTNLTVLMIDQNNHSIRPLFVLLPPIQARYTVISESAGDGAPANTNSNNQTGELS